MKLINFNNLSKNLYLSFYDFIIISSKKDKKQYIKYINKNYSSKKLSNLAKKITKKIDANILNISEQNYKPYGASSLILLSDIDYHLDKSHISIHTYPYINKNFLGIRIDVEISTCGNISPLKILNNIFKYFPNDIVTINYMINGYTLKNNKIIFQNNKIKNISSYINKNILKKYEYKEYNNKRNWNSKFIIKKYNIKEYFYKKNKIKLLLNKQLLSNRQQKKFKTFLKFIRKIYKKI